MICADRPAALERDEPFQVIPVGWQHGVPDLVASALFSRRVAQLITRQRYDVAYGQNLALWHCSARDVPLVMNPHGMEPMQVRGLWPRLRGTLRRRAFRLTARRARRVVSLGGKLSDQIVQLLGVPPSKVVEIPNAIEIEDIDRRINAGGDPPRRLGALLYVGRLASNKGLEVLFKALQLLAPHTPSLLIVGTGPLEARLRAASPSQVQFLGRLSDLEITHLFRSVDSLVLPSLYEGLPTIILEAMAHGTPVIATDVGAVMSVVGPHTGFVVPPGDPVALAAAITKLRTLDEGARRALGSRAREHVMGTFTWSAVARRTLALFDELLSTHNW